MNRRVELDLSQLESHLWEAANILRCGPVDRTDWKSYILPLLFFKRICDVWDEEQTEMAWTNKDLEQLCLTDRLQKKQLGQSGARKLRARLADLMATARLTELLAGHPHPLTGDRAGQFALRLDGGRRLVFEAEHDPPPRKDDGSLDWSQVTAIRILFIGDYHD